MDVHCAPAKKRLMGESCAENWAPIHYLIILVAAPALVLLPCLGPAVLQMSDALLGPSGAFLGKLRG